MATCAKCGASLAENVSFCPSCGMAAGASAGTSQPAARGASTGSGIPSNIASLLCYIVWPIICILFLILEPYSKDKFVRFHAFQSLFLGLASIGVAIVASIATAVLGFIPLVGWLLDILIWTAFGLGMLALVIFLMYKAYSNEQYMVPWVGNLAAQQAGRPL